MGRILYELYKLLLGVVLFDVVLSTDLSESESGCAGLRRIVDESKLIFRYSFQESSVDWSLHVIHPSVCPTESFFFILVLLYIR